MCSIMPQRSDSFERNEFKASSVRGSRTHRRRAALHTADWVPTDEQAAPLDHRSEGV
jgi:hypothetical protein